MVVLILKGQICSGKNAQLINTKTKQKYAGKRFEEWRSNWFDQIEQQIGGMTERERTKIRTEQKILVGYVRGDNRVRDVPGMQDALCHLLERADVIENDKLLVDWTWIRIGYNEADPGVILKIEDRTHKETGEGISDYAARQN